MEIDDSEHAHHYPSINDHEPAGWSEDRSLSSPWNLTATHNRQGWLLHWEHPISGLELLRHYNLQWWREPEHHLVGSVETSDNFYQLRQLKEAAAYSFQAVALGEDGSQVASDILTLTVTSRKSRVLLIASCLSVILLLSGLAAFLYVKRSCLKHFFAGGRTNINNDDDACEGSLDYAADSLHSQDVEKTHNT